MLGTQFSALSNANGLMRIRKKVSSTLTRRPQRPQALDPTTVCAFTLCPTQPSPRGGRHVKVPRSTLPSPLCLRECAYLPVLLDDDASAASFMIPSHYIAELAQKIDLDGILSSANR